MPARKKSRHFLLKLFAAAIALAAITAVVLFLWVRWQLSRPVKLANPDQIITIEPGSGTETVMEKLSKIGIVRHPRLLQLYLTVTRGNRRLRAGDYKFPSPISPLQALDRIRRGEVYYQRVTIPEGFNRFEIAELLAEKTKKASAEKFLELMNDTKAIDNIDPKASNLEGYLFPDTYNFNSRTTAAELVSVMVRRFNEVFTPEWAQRTTELKMSVHQVVTLASIIEKEAKVPGDRALIASALTNRLALGMPLAADPTFIYAAQMARDYDGNPNQPRYRRSTSPYNTYVYPGLPPGPIASPGKASLEAALYPAQTDFLYYVVAGADGHHKFSRTAAEHELAVQQYHQLRDQLNHTSGH